MKKKTKILLKSRGIRLTDYAWQKLSEDAAKQHSTPSELVRMIIAQYYRGSQKTVIAADNT